jgi:hypothetical protein
MTIDLDNPPDEARPYVELYERTKKDRDRLLAENQRLMRKLKAADLSSDELEALRHIRIVYPNATGMHHDEAERAMAVLDKLLRGVR